MSAPVRHMASTNSLKRIKSGHALPTAPGSSQLICSLLIHFKPSKLSVQHLKLCHCLAVTAQRAPIDKLPIRAAVVNLWVRITPGS